MELVNSVNYAHQRDFCKRLTDEEIETLVEGFILGLDDQEWLSMKSELGEEKAKEKIRAGIVKMDERNLINITPKGSVQ